MERAGFITAINEAWSMLAVLTLIAATAVTLLPRSRGRAHA